MLRFIPSPVRAAGVLALVAAAMPAQPLHPRLLFTSADVPALQAKINGGGAPAQSYASMVSSAGLQTSSSQFSYVVYRSLRRMQEVAFRYQMTGQASYADNAKNLLLQVVGWLSPTGSKAYLSSTYPCAMALTFDMIYDRLSPAERSQVVAHLESWVTAMRNGSTGWASYSSFQAAVDNYSMGWCTGIAFTLMAIEGDSSYPNLQTLVHENLQKLHDGWQDAISPDGSVDEAYGYANYGNLYSMNAGVAAINCGYGDYLAGTNILKTPGWFAASYTGQDFVWIGDSSPSHKGNRVDPVLYYPLTRPDADDPEALWALEKIFAAEPPSDYSPSQAWSPLVNHVLYYPAGLSPQVPEVQSGFFRDNLNQGSAWSNKLTAHAAVGDGGHALLHNSADPTWSKLCTYYMIRDEWMTHNHEDDGHLSLGVGGSWHYMDIGYAEQGSWKGAQSTDHNIVLVQGESGFRGSSTNYYSPPSNGRFYGRRREVMVSPWMDYVRGDHAHMWMMQEAERSVVMIKDPVAPYVILVDHVNKDGATHTYEEFFHAAGPAQGQGTPQSPLSISASGSTLKAVWLAPQTATVVPASGSATNAGMQYWRHRVTGAGSEVNFVSVHGPSMPGQITPLGNPLPGTRGGVLSWGAATDIVLVNVGQGSLGGHGTSGDARFAWLRKTGGQTTAWAVGEGQSLVHEGTSVLNTNKTVTAVARNGRIFIHTSDGSGPAGLTLSARISFSVTDVVVDDQSVAFTQSGEQVTVGGPALPTESVDDRAYTFTGGYMGDGVPAPLTTVTADDKLTSTGGWSSFHLKGGDLLGGRPLSLGMHVRLLPGALGNEAGFILETAAGAQDVLKVMAAPASNSTFKVRVMQGGTTLGEATLAYGLDGVTGRFYVWFDPVAGNVEVRDVVDTPVAAVALAPFPGTFKGRVALTRYALVDDVTLFDSLEDGQTPQGVAFYTNHLGVGGMVIRVPTIHLTQSWKPVHNGTFINPLVAELWYAAGGLQEFLLSTQLPVGSGAPASLSEAGFEFAVPSVDRSPGSSTGMWLKGVTGVELFGSVDF